MTGAVDDRSATEWPIVFPAGSVELFGILTEPMTALRRIGVVLLVGGAYTPSVSRHRVSVKLARRLAASGFHVLRFDYHGVGESTGTIHGVSLNRPFTPDVVAAVEELRRRQLPQVILVGARFGARTALSAAGRVGGVSGMALMSMPLRDTEEKQRVRREAMRRGRYVRALTHGLQVLRRGLRPLGREGRGPTAEGVSPSVLIWLREAVRRELSLFFLYGSEEEHYAEFQRAQTGEVGALLARAGSRAEVSIVEGSGEGLASERGQEAGMARIQRWLESLTAQSQMSLAR